MKLSQFFFLGVLLMSANLFGQVATDNAEKYFTPRKQIVFIDYLSQSTVGQFPEKWKNYTNGTKAGKGCVTVREDSVRYINWECPYSVRSNWADSQYGGLVYAAPIQPNIPDYYLPDSFTIDFVVQLHPVKLAKVSKATEMGTEAGLFINFLPKGNEEMLSTAGAEIAIINDSLSIGFHTFEKPYSQEEKQFSLKGIPILKPVIVKDVHQWHHWAVSVVGKRAVFYLDGLKVGVFDDLPYRAVSVGISKHGMAAFRNFRITRGRKCQEFDSLIAQQTMNTNSINFASGKWDLTNSAQIYLNDFSTWLKKNSTIKVSVTGFTDSVGTEQANQALSLKRANAIVLYLCKQGIPKERLKAKGLGGTRPVASNNQNDGRSMNRRVEFELIQ